MLKSAISLIGLACAGALILSAPGSSVASPAERFEREKARAPFRNPYWYIQTIDPQPYVARNYAPAAVRMKAYIAYAKRLPGIAANIRANLAGPLPRSFVELAIRGFGGYATLLGDQSPAL